MDASFAAAAVSFFGAIVVWAVRQEGRLNGHDRELRMIREDAEQRDRDLRDDLQYIRQRIDAAIDGRVR